MSLRKKRLVKFEIVLKQNLLGIMIIVLWFILNYLVLLAQTGSILLAVQHLFYIKELDTNFGHFYSVYSEYVVFGLIIGLVTIDALRNYNPRTTCEILASKLDHHAIVFGYNIFGMRISKMLKKLGIPHVVASIEEENVLDLIDDEKPVIIYDEKDESFMKKVRITKAKYLFLTLKDHFLNLDLIIKTRKVNRTCKIIVRVHDDSLIPIYKLYKTHPVATSTSTSHNVFNNYLDEGMKNIFFVGFNDFTKKISDIAIEKDIKVHFIEKDEEDLEAYKSYIHVKTKNDKNDLKLHKGNYMDISFLERTRLFKGDAIVIAEDIKEDMLLFAKMVKDIVPGMKILVRCFDENLKDVFKSLGCITIYFSIENEIRPLLEDKKKEVGGKDRHKVNKKLCFHYSKFH